MGAAELAAPRPAGGASTARPHGEDLALLKAAVIEAGAVALRHFGGTVATWTKPDGTPVSEADMATDEALRARLCGARPHYGWVSEELGARAGVAGACTFVVDPIDGTRDFLEGGRNWTVVAAVVAAGRPVAAALFQPMTGTLYTGALSGGAERNGCRVLIPARDSLRGAPLAVPAPMFRDRGLAAGGAVRAPWVRSLALRLAMVADGQLAGVITKAGPHHWDLAAADLIVHEAGGSVTTAQGTLLEYDADATDHPAVVASRPGLAPSLRAAAMPLGEMG